jgi:hypothetical protein
MPHDPDRQRQIEEVAARLARQTSRIGNVLALLIILGSLCLALLAVYVVDLSLITADNCDFSPWTGQAKALDSLVSRAFPWPDRQLEGCEW